MIRARMHTEALGVYFRNRKLQNKLLFNRTNSPDKSNTY